MNKRLKSGSGTGQMLSGTGGGGDNLWNPLMLDFFRESEFFY